MPSIWIGDKDITKELSKKSMAILIYIIFSKGKTAGREELLAIFWKESDPKAGRYNLRHNLWNIRRVFRKCGFDSEWLEADNHHIKVIESALFQVDTERLFLKTKTRDNQMTAISDASIQRIIDAYSGEFLDRFYLSDCEEFNDWVYYKREDYQRQYIELLTSIRESCQLEKRYALVISILKRQTKFMPYDEAVHYMLIKAMYEHGSSQNAMKFYERYKKRLREELNVAPEESLTTLFNDMKASTQKKMMAQMKENKVVLKLCNNPFHSIEYMYLSELLDEISKQIDDEKLNAFNDYYWMDLSRINSQVKKYIKSNKSIKDILTESTEKIRVFKALYELLKFIANDYALIVLIDRDLILDPYSREFFDQLSEVRFIECVVAENSF